MREKPNGASAPSSDGPSLQQARQVTVKSLEAAARDLDCSPSALRGALKRAGWRAPRASAKTRAKPTPAQARKVLDVLRSIEKTAIAFDNIDVGELREILNQPDRRGRKPRPDDPAERLHLLEALRKHGSTRVAAAACKMSQTTFLRRIKEPV